MDRIFLLESFSDTILRVYKEDEKSVLVKNLKGKIELHQQRQIQGSHDH